MPQIGYSHRPVALGTRGMVAAAHPLATLAGIETLKSGGTAADAAVAVTGGLAVPKPNSGGPGGALFCLYYEAATGGVHSLTGGGRSGARASLGELARRGLDRLPVIGPPTVSVPGCVRAWAMLLERFGTRPLGDLLRPAISAADGFPISSLVSQAIHEYASVTPDPEWHRVFAPGGRAPALGERFAQPDLARTLRDLAADGPDLFYTGRVGQAIAGRLEPEGFLTVEDLATHTGEWGEPIATTYRGVRVFQTPPPTPGVAAPAGNVISVIQSLFNAFGSGVVVAGTGVVLQNRGRHFSLDPAHPAALAPRKRPFHTLIASIVTRDDEPLLALATMGGNGQAMFHAQVVTNVLDYGMDIQEAIERPRFLIGAFLPDEPADTTHIEARVPGRVVAALEGRGHRVKTAPEFFTRVGHAHGIVPRDGTLMGGADPRGDGAALGF